MNPLFVFYHYFDALGKSFAGSACFPNCFPLTEWASIEKLQNIICDDLNSQNMGVKRVMIIHWQRLENVTH